MKLRDRFARSLQGLHDLLLGAPKLSKDHELVIPGPGQFKQRRDLGIAGLAGPFGRGAQPALGFFVARAFSQLLQRFAGRQARAAQFLLQRHQGHPREHLRCLAHPRVIIIIIRGRGRGPQMHFDKSGHVIVQRPFIGPQRDWLGSGVAPRQPHRDIRAAISHHRFGQQAMQLIQVTRDELIAAIDKLLLEALGGTE